MQPLGDSGSGYHFFETRHCFRVVSKNPTSGVIAVLGEPERQTEFEIILSLSLSLLFGGGKIEH